MSLGWGVQSVTNAMSLWVDGWTRSRRTPPPQQIGPLWRVETGTEKESVRWLVPEPTPELVRGLLEQEHPRNTAVKVFGPPEVWEPLFPAGWEADIPVVLMTRALAARPVPRLDPAYAVEVERESSSLVLVRVLHESGAPAARGQVGLGERTAVPDQIVTEPDHRRRGLASVVMALLEEAAVRSGLRTGVLGASTDGRGLYESLGWSVAGPRTGMYLRS
jgi:GNAT superfamily N-acetyltransferase